MVDSVVESQAEIVIDSTEKKIRVLHVDDEPALLKVAKQCLEMQGPFRVDSVSSVEEALAKLAKERYDAVVSDYQMPGKDGLEFLKELRESGNSVPFIMFTGKGREEVAIRALNLGANQYLNKTGETETVYTELAHAIAELAKTKKAEELVRLSEERYRNLFENANSVIILFDLKGNVTSVNKGAEEYGFSRSGMLGKNMLKFVSKRYWPKLLKDVAQIALGKTAEGRIEMHTPKGDKIAEYRSNPIFSDNRVVGIQTILEDTTGHEKAEEELRESEGRYDVLIESISDVFFTMDRDFRYTDWNKASERLTGISAKDAIGKSLTEVFPDVEGTEVEQFYQNTLRTNQHQTFVNKYRMGDKDFVFEIDAYPTKDGLSVFAKDISERKKTEETLRESEEKYRNLFESAIDAIVTLDLKGSITAVNSSVLRFGYEKEDLVGKNILDFVSKEYWPAVMRDFSKVAQGEPAKNEVELAAPAGKILVEYHAGAIAKENNVAGVQINIRDVTERKKSEELLRESEGRFRGLFESIQDPVGIFVGKEGHLIDYNTAFKKSSGYADEELKGKVFLDFVHPEDRAMVLEKYQTKYSEEELPLVYEIRGMNKKGESVPLELSVSTYKQKGKIIGIEVIHRDITERRKAEQTLKESEEKYRDLVELAPDGIVAVNAEGIVTSANRSFLRLVGYDSDEGIVGKPFTELKTIRVEDIPKFQEMFSSLMNGEPLSPVEFLYVRKDGTSRWAEVHPGLLIEDGKPVGVQVVMRDVSERKNAEKLIQENQQKFEQLFMSNPEAAVYVDPNERVLNVNPRFTELFGYSFDEVKEKFLDDFVVPEDRRKEALMLAQKGKEGYVYYETVRKNKKGSPIPVALSSAPIVLQGQHLGDIVLYKDITELKRAQEESEESRKHFQMLFDLMADPVAVVDGRGKILEVTQKVEEITGFKKEELVGKNLLKTKMFGAKTKAVMIKKLAERMMGTHVEPYEVELLKKDGGKLMYEINAAKIDYKGKPADLVVFRDILERKNLEEKLRVVGSLTRHDVRNKLCAVTGNAYLLRRKLAGNPEALEQLADMENAVRNVETIFEFARTYEKLGVEQLAYMDVKKTVDEAVGMFPDLQGVKIVNECGGLTVLADSLLRQLFYNLIDDSLKYGEKLTQIRIRYEKSENQLKLVYEDDGVGISKDNKAKLFNEGFTTGKGSGYGLYLIRRMMEVYGWAIDETGTHGKGAQFTMNIPKAKPDGRQNYKLG
ncbi:MAG: PAS domain S-box protein [Candidatus Bathyarchaeia archaeon]|jgi:PAS domain S-box-containing protein